MKGCSIILSALCLWLLASSCTREVVLDAMEDPTVVVECILCQDPVQTLYLSYTKGASREEAPDMPRATAVLTDLTEGKEAGHFLKGADGTWYLEYSAIPSHRYRLDVEIPGYEPIWAEQDMPAAPGIDVKWDPWRENRSEDTRYRQDHGYIFSARKLSSPVWFYGVNHPDAGPSGEKVETLWTDYRAVDDFNRTEVPYPVGERDSLWGCFFTTSAYPDLADAPSFKEYLRFPAGEGNGVEFLVSGDFRGYMADPGDFVHCEKRFAELHYFSASEDYDRFLVNCYEMDQIASSSNMADMFLRDNVHSNINGATGILGAKVEQCLRWDDDRNWGNGPFFLTRFEEGDGTEWNIDHDLGLKRMETKRAPFSLLHYEIKAGIPDEWKYGASQDPQQDAYYLQGVTATYLIEDEGQLREHGLDVYGPVDFSRKNVLVRYDRFEKSFVPFFIDYGVEKDSSNGTYTMYVYMFYALSSVDYPYKNPFTSFRIALVVDKADDSFPDVRLEWDGDFSLRQDDFIEGKVLPEMGVYLQ